MSELFLSKLPRSLRIEGPVEERLLTEYGAMLVAKNVLVPDKVVFRDEADVSGFQSRVPISSEIIGGISIELQSAPMDALRMALAEAEDIGKTISPRGTDSARRSYDETVGLWASRVEPALKHWVSLGQLEEGEAEGIRSLSPFEQVPVILGLEDDGIFFAKDLSKSIVYSVAPPGTSQHLAMLALDIKEHADPQIRGILARHQWFQTVISDLPHFTYLGLPEDKLTGSGLKMVMSGDREFWVPDT